MQNMQLKELIKECFDCIKSKNYQLARHAGENAVRLCPNSVDAHWCLGKVYYYLARFNPNYFNFSIGELKRAEELARSMDNKSDKRDLAATCSEFGDDCKRHGLISYALPYYEESLRIYTDLSDIEGKCIVLNNIAEIYEMGNYNKALEYYNKAIECFKKAMKTYQENGDSSKTAQSMINMVRVYIKLKDFSEAEHYLTQGLKMVKKLVDKDLEAYAYETYGLLYSTYSVQYTTQNQEDLVKEYFTKSYNYFTKSYNLYKSIGNNSEAQRIYEAYLKKMNELNKHI